MEPKRNWLTTSKHEIFTLSFVILFSVFFKVTPHFPNFSPLLVLFLYLGNILLFSRYFCRRCFIRSCSGYWHKFSSIRFMDFIHLLWIPHHWIVWKVEMVFSKKFPLYLGLHKFKFYFLDMDKCRRMVTEWHVSSYFNGLDSLLSSRSSFFK